MNQCDILAVPKVTVFSMSPQPASISCTRLSALLLVVVVLVEFGSRLWPRLNSWFLHSRMRHSGPPRPPLPPASSLLSPCGSSSPSGEGASPLHPSAPLWLGGSRPSRPFSTDRLPMHHNLLLPGSSSVSLTRVASTVSVFMSPVLAMWLHSCCLLRKGFSLLLRFFN